MADTISMLPTLRLQLAEAELAFHKLATGTKEQSVSYDGKSVTFSQSNRADLMTYMTSLRQRIAALEGGTFARRRPIHMTF